MAAHSEFPASSAKRNLTCAAAFAASLPYAGGPRKSSVFAAEGTAAHAFAEAYLRDGTPIPDGGTWSADGHSGPWTPELADFVREYTDVVESLKALGFEVWLEQKVSPNWFWEPGGKKPPLNLFGTADCIALNAETRTLTVVDLKFGRGIAVEVEDNVQLLYYATGALAATWADRPGQKIDHVEIMVVQPRAPHPEGRARTQRFTVKEVVEWAEGVLVPGVEKAVAVANKKLPPEYKAGDHCRFCPALLSCPEIEKTRQDAAAGVFDDMLDAPLGPTVEELAKLLDQAEIMERVAARIMDAAYERATVSGEEIPGWKLVPKRAVRSWNDAASAEEELAAAGVSADVYLDRPEFKSPAKVLGDRAVKNNAALVAALKPFVSSISSGTTLVRDSDPRPAVAARPQAADVFD